jgi:hypothetical protein
MVFNATFNTISVLSWWSVVLVEETGVLRENHRPVASHWQTLSPGFELTTSGGVGTNYIGSSSQLAYDHDHDGPFRNCESQINK